MIDQLVAESEEPPRTVKGVGQDFLDGLERVPLKSLKRDAECPICGQPFLDGMVSPPILPCCPLLPFLPPLPSPLPPTSPFPPPPETPPT